MGHDTVEGYGKSITVMASEYEKENPIENWNLNICDLINCLSCHWVINCKPQTTNSIHSVDFNALFRFH